VRPWSPYRISIIDDYMVSMMLTAHPQRYSGARFTSAWRVAMMRTTVSPVLAAPKRPVFYSWLAVTLAAAVFIGFAPTFYLRGWFMATPLPSALVAIHGTVFSSWVFVLLLQVLFVRAGRVRMHRRFGRAAAVLSVVMVLVAIPTPVAQAKRFFGDWLPTGISAHGRHVRLVRGWLRRVCDTRCRCRLLQAPAGYPPAADAVGEH
jgi:hypothetical protein